MKDKQLSRIDELVIDIAKHYTNPITGQIMWKIARKSDDTKFKQLLAETNGNMQRVYLATNYLRRSGHLKRATTAAGNPYPGRFPAKRKYTRRLNTKWHVATAAPAPVTEKPQPKVRFCKYCGENIE